MNILDKYEVINYTAGSRDKYVKGLTHLYDTIVHYQNGEIHRDDDLPAVICQNGNKRWYYHGKQHRQTLDSNGQQLPASIDYYGKINLNPAIALGWYINGNLHRHTLDADGKQQPSVVQSDDVKMWYINGVIKRTDVGQDNQLLPTRECVDIDILTDEYVTNLYLQLKTKYDP